MSGLLGLPVNVKYEHRFSNLPLSPSHFILPSSTFFNECNFVNVTEYGLFKNI